MYKKLSTLFEKSKREIKIEHLHKAKSTKSTPTHAKKRYLEMYIDIYVTK